MEKFIGGLPTLRIPRDVSSRPNWSKNFQEFKEDLAFYQELSTKNKTSLSDVDKEYIKAIMKKYHIHPLSRSRHKGKGHWAAHVIGQSIVACLKRDGDKLIIVSIEKHAPRESKKQYCKDLLKR